MTKEEIIMYQEKQTKRSRDNLDKIIEKSIKELEEYKNTESWKMIAYLEGTLERLENARKEVEKDILELNLIKSVFNTLEIN